MTPKSTSNLSGSVVFAAVVGALGLAFAAGLAYWWLAHQMAWWTYSLLVAGVMVGRAVLSTAIEEARK